MDSRGSWGLEFLRLVMFWLSVIVRKFGFNLFGFRFFWSRNWE